MTISQVITSSIYMGLYIYMGHWVVVESCDNVTEKKEVRRF